MIKYLKHRFALELVRNAIIGAETYNAIRWYLYEKK